MDLETFVKNSLMQIVRAVDSASEESVRYITLTSTAGQRTVEFDVAVTVENDQKMGGKAAIKVLHFVGDDTSLETVNKNSTVSRVMFGVHIDIDKKEEQERKRRQIEEINNRNRVLHNPI
jgi:hypothetical protein